MQYAVGVDEVGRGPLAGPVVVCAVQWLTDADPFSVLTGIRDSKKLSAKQRNEWVDQAKGLQDSLRFCVHSVDAGTIDTVGIMRALGRASGGALAELDAQDSLAHVYSDYGLPVPEQYSATHIVKGDERHPLIALASIIAKENRDAVMVTLAETFRVYGFSRNKGYGTQEHRDALLQYGPCSVHRKTFLKNIG